MNFVIFIIACEERGSFSSLKEPGFGGRRRNPNSRPSSYSRVEQGDQRRYSRGVLKVTRYTPIWLLKDDPQLSQAKTRGKNVRGVSQARTKDDKYSIRASSQSRTRRGDRGF